MSNQKMGSIVLISLSILLGLFFIFVGFIKISSVLSKDLHKDLRKEYVKYAKVFPLSEMLDFKIPSKWYRRTVGGLEIICGSAMAFWPNRNNWSDTNNQRCRKPVSKGERLIIVGAGNEQGFVRDKIKNLSNIMLLLLTLMAVYSHYMVADKLERTAPALVFLFMLTGRLVVFFQLQKREQEQREPTANGFKQE